MGLFSQWWDASDGAYRLYIIVLLCMLPCLILGLVANARVHSTFRRFAASAAACGKTGAQIAREILDRNGLQYVQIKPVAGQLTDYYDSSNEVLALSEATLRSSSVAAIGVACHEVGHALQHSDNYLFLAFRTRLAPMVNFVTNLLWPVFILGMFFGFASYSALGNIFIWAGVILFGAALLFSLVTLPVEFNASRRAMHELSEGGYLTAEERSGAKKVLRAAAMTYVASFIMTTLQFLRMLALLLMARNRRR